MVPRIGEREIRARVGEKNFERGRSYATFGAIFDARRSGSTLRARCESSSDETWRVRVDFDARSVRAMECTCPMGEEGPCKHIAALLLAWVRRPEEFVETPSIEAAIASRSREELALALRELLARRPDLEPMLESVIAPANDQHAAEGSVRQRASVVFRRFGYEEGAAESIVRELSPLLADARDALADRPTEAAAAAEQLAQAVIGRFRKVRDERQALVALVDEAVGVMADAFVRLAHDSGARRTILRTAMGLFRFDVEQGVGLGGVGPGRRAAMTLVARASPEERAEVSQGVRDVMERCDEWARRAWGSLLLELDFDVLDDAAWMTLWQTTRQTSALVRRHVARGRVAEALAECARVNDHELATLAEVFECHGHGEAVEEMVTARAERGAHPRLVAWLKARAARRDDAAAALGVAETVFHARPDVEGYEAFKRECEAVGQWARMQPRAKDFLEQRSPVALAEIALTEGDIERACALALGERLKGSGAPSLKGRIAEKADALGLPEALRLHQAHVEALIAQRGRGNYREACRVALRVSELMGNDREGFEQWLGALRDKNGNLSALREELDAVFAPKAA